MKSLLHRIDIRLAGVVRTFLSGGNDWKPTMSSCSRFNFPLVILLLFAAICNSQEKKPEFTDLELQMRANHQLIGDCQKLSSIESEIETLRAQLRVLNVRAKSLGENIQELKRTAKVSRVDDALSTTSIYLARAIPGKHVTRSGTKFVVSGVDARSGTLVVETELDHFDIELGFFPSTSIPSDAVELETLEGKLFEGVLTYVSIFQTKTIQVRFTGIDRFNSTFDQNHLFLTEILPMIFDFNRIKLLEKNNGK